MCWNYSAVEDRNRGENALWRENSQSNKEVGA